MDAFWCITLSILVIRWYWNNHRREPRQESEPIPETVITKELINADKSEKEKMEAEKQRQKDIADLKKQGYTDEIIAVILPTINSNQ